MGKKETIPDCPSDYAGIIQKTWVLPDQRPTAEEIFKELEKNKPKPEEQYTERSWHFDPKTKQMAQLTGKDYTLLPASPKDIEKVTGFYAHHPVPGCVISKVEVIYNPGFNRGFELHLRKLSRKDNNPSCVPNWSTMSNPELRQTTYNMFSKLTQPYTDPDYPSVKLLPAWHGTKPQVLHSLFTAGYLNLSTTDIGYFGKGYYLAYEAEYSYRVYSKGALILNWVASFSPLPVVDNDMSELELEGKSNYGNYDAHFVPVKPKNPTDPNETIYLPCKAGEPHQYTEMVVFDSAALLPRYLVELQPELIKSPIQPVRVPGESVYYEGLLAFQHTQYKKAHTCFEQAASEQYPAAYLWLGNLYQNYGFIGARNPDISKQWYSKVKTQIRWFKTQAQTGQVDAQNNLGWCYQDGEGVKKDLAEAVRYYRLASDQGYAIAQRNLGMCYYEGDGVIKDLAEAVYYYRLAADQGYSIAQYNLGRCYYNGEGVKKDFIEAVRYYCLAADQGLSNAQCSLGWCYQNGEGVKKDLTKAVHYYRLAADQGHATAQNNLGWCYYDCPGVTKDLEEAVRYCRLAANQGHVHAQSNLTALLKAHPFLKQSTPEEKDQNCLVM